MPPMRVLVTSRPPRVIGVAGSTDEAPAGLRWLGDAGVLVREFVLCGSRPAAPAPREDFAACCRRRSASERPADPARQATRPRVDRPLAERICSARTASRRGHDPQVGQAAHSSPVSKASLHVADGPADVGPTNGRLVNDRRIETPPELPAVGVAEVEGP
jgi:hypothetical protein